MKGKIRRELLYQHWVHSHEEDTDAELVFRPATFNFPRSRGRFSFELKADGGLVESGIAPDDRQQQTQGSWKLEDDDHLILYTPSPSKPKRVMRIASVNKTRLVIRK